MTPWKWLRGVFLLVAIASCSSIFAAQTASSTLSPTADAFVGFGSGGSLANRNFGGAGGLAIASASGSPNGEFQSVMKFDFAPARNTFNTQFGANQWTIQSVTLRVNAAVDRAAIFDNTTAGQFRVLWMQNDSWIEGTGTPNLVSSSGISYNSLQNTFASASDEDLGTFSFNGLTSGATTYTLGLAPGFEADMEAGNSVSFHMTPASANLGYVFNSRSFVTGSSRPVLTVTAAAVPEPATFALVAAGFVFIGVQQIRARRSPR